MSASCGPIGAEFVYERFRPLYGSPMLSMRLASSRAGTIVAQDLVDLIADDRRLLDARAGRCADVQLELAAVDRREEVLPDPRQQHERDDAEEEKGAREQPLTVERHRSNVFLYALRTRRNRIVDGVLQSCRRNPRAASAWTG